MNKSPSWERLSRIHLPNFILFIPLIINFGQNILVMWFITIKMSSEPLCPNQIRKKI